MKLTSSFAALSSVVVIALCLGQAQADTVTSPLGLTQVDDKGAPITPLTYLNLEPASKELSDAAKKVTTPPPMLKTQQKRLLPNAGDHLEPFVEQFTSQGISIRELGNSLIPSLPILGALDNEGDHTNANPPTEAQKAEAAKHVNAPAVQRRVLDALKALDLPDSSEVMPANQQTLGQRTPHPLNRRADDPLNLNILGKNVPELLPKLPMKRGQASGLNLFGHDIPIEAIAIPSQKRGDSPLDLGLKTGNEQDLDAAKSLFGGLLPIKRGDGPVDLGLKTGNEQDAEAAKSLLSGLLPIKRDDAAFPSAADVPVKPLDLGLQTGNEQDMDRAKSFVAGLLPIRRDTISPDNIDLTSVKALGQGLAAEGAKDAIPVALAPVKQTASPAVEVIKTGNALCTSFGCQQAVQGAFAGVTKELPVPLPQARALGDKDKDLFANGLLNGNGEVNGIPVRRAQDPVTSVVLDTSDKVRDDILDLKTQADNAAGSFVKNMYTEHGQIETKRALNLPSYSLFPGSGPKAKEALEEVKDAVDFVGLPVGVPGLKRMTKVVKRSA